MLFIHVDLIKVAEYKWMETDDEPVKVLRVLVGFTKDRLPIKGNLSKDQSSICTKAPQN